MTTEWLVLWTPFLCISVLAMVFSAVAWRQIGIVLGPAMSRAVSDKAIEVANKRRRLLQITVMVALCLLLNTIATLSTTATLEEWSRTADLSLTCSIGETWLTRNWEAYGFNNEDLVNVCNAKAANGIQAQKPCMSDCVWYPSLQDFTLICVQEDSGYTSLENMADEFTLEKMTSAGCDCPCSAFVQVKRPRFHCSSFSFGGKCHF
jgi:hypothetical protein